jgi:hypothetical protein
MKPIEKYQQKFIELLKEAEEELGGDLCIKASSTKEMGETGNALYAGQLKKVYRCSISTTNAFLL